MKRSETATLAGGCFWCLEAVFDRIKGVERVDSGYAGGHVPNPSYEMVCSGTTGHAEVVQVTFDPDVISYRDLLDIFFTIHDPTQLNRQGPDEGTQYRSAVFCHTPEQLAQVEQTIADLEGAGLWERPIVTQVTPLETFYPAEEYHRDYYERNPGQGYCSVVIAPKVAKARQRFLERWIGVVLLVFLAVGGGLEAQAVPDLSGRWVRQLTAADTTLTADAAGEEEWRGAPTWARGGPVPERDQQQIARLLGMARPVSAVEIQQGDDEVTFTNEGGFTYSVRPDGRRREVVFDTLKLDVRARWRDGDLVVEWRPEGGGSISERYTLTTSRRFLRYEVSVQHHRMTGWWQVRMYERER